jgi:site-specific recombinase XerD
MGKECRRPVDPGSEHYIGQVISSCAQDGENLGEKLTEKAVWHVVRQNAVKADNHKLAPHDLRRTCVRLCYAAGGELEQIQFLLGHVSIQTTEKYLGCKQRIQGAVNDKIGIEPPD